MKVELLQEWLGHRAGTVLDLKDGVAKPMIDRGAAKEAKDKQLKRPPAEKEIKEASTK